jgi:hypothetical protein
MESTTGLYGLRMRPLPTEERIRFSAQVRSADPSTWDQAAIAVSDRDKYASLSDALVEFWRSCNPPPSPPARAILTALDSGLPVSEAFAKAREG